MDYSVRDSSVLPDPHAMKVYDESDANIRVGIVREERTVSDETTRYIVEVAYQGRQIPVSCVLLSRWGGAYNYEEYRVRPWVKNFPANLLAPASASKYELRSGDVVLVAFLDGQSREGVILGGLRHNARKEKTTPGNIEYISEFNGLETQIRTDGSYKVTFKGAPVTEALLAIPPAGQPVPDAAYNPLVAGSFYGFDAEGSYIVSDGTQFMKIKKGAVDRGFILESGQNRIDMSGNLLKGKLGIKTDELVLEASLKASIKATAALNASAIQVSIRGTQMAIGSDQFELFDGLVKLIDGLGGLIVTSPVGTCTPLMAAPTWATAILPLKIKIQTMVMGLQDPDSFEESDAGETELANDIGS
jgi:hypothetical protein